MPLLFLSEEWAAAVCAALNESDRYRESARSWSHGPVVIGVETPAGDTRYVQADVERGVCRSVKIREDENPKAAMTISGPMSVWKDVLFDGGNPATEMARGRMKFRGNWFHLVRYQKAAEALIEAVSRIDTEFPE